MIVLTIPVIILLSFIGTVVIGYFKYKKDVKNTNKNEYEVHRLNAKPVELPDSTRNVHTLTKECIDKAIKIKGEYKEIKYEGKILYSIREDKYIMTDIFGRACVLSEKDYNKIIDWYDDKPKKI